MDSNLLAENYFGSIALKQRLIGSDLPDLQTVIFGQRFETPIATAALSNLNYFLPNGMRLMAEGARQAGALCFSGMMEDAELTPLVQTGAKVIRIVKPHRDNEAIISQIHASKENGAFAVGCDIDHAYNGSGAYDDVQGIPCRPKTIDDLKLLVREAGELPFIVKGVLSIEDALASVEAGAKGIVVSSHHGIMDSMVPPLYVLPEIRKAVGDAVTIFLDGSVQSGTDVFKALALGADAVCVGRSLLASIKDKGDSAMLQELCRINSELATCMARTGYKNVGEIDEHCLVFMR